MEIDIKAAVAAVQAYLHGRVYGDELPLGAALKRFEDEHGICGKTDGQLVILDYNTLSPSLSWSEPYGYVCRGLILDARTFDVISFGLPKFWNLGESEAAAIDWSTARVVEKLDGSMVQRFFNPHTSRFEYSTRYQLPHELAKNEVRPGLTWLDLINRCIDPSTYPVQPPNRTFVYEVMSPANRIVVRQTDYSSKLIAVRELRDLEERVVPDDVGPRSFSYTSATETQIYAETFKGTDQEGFVVVDGSFRRVKVKGSDYVRLHRLKDNNASPRALINLARSGDYEEVLTHFPELRPPVEQAIEALETLVRAHEAANDDLKSIEAQKDFAIAVNARGLQYPAALFLARSGKASSIRAAFEAMRESAFVDLVRSRLPPDFGI